MNRKISLFKELKRRNVFNVAIAYVISSWLLAQVADLVLEDFATPPWVMPVLLIALAVGFPIALLISWVFEVTSRGVIAESEIDRTVSISDQSGERLNRIIITILAIIIVFMGLERFLFSGHVRNQQVERPGKSVPASETGGNGREIGNGSLTAVSPSPFSVAILPFALTSNGPDDDYFADGLTEAIINALSQLPELAVTARTSAFHFKGQNVPVGEIGAQLGVAHVVVGSVHRAGEQLQITAQLLRASDGSQLWSETYDRHTDETFAVQQDVSEKVATAMNVPLVQSQRTRMARAGMRNVEAFIAYQKGRELRRRAYQEGVDISLLRQANVQFEDAIALAPDFREAYVQHVDLYVRMLLSNASGQLDGNITDADIESAPDALRLGYVKVVDQSRNDHQRLIAEIDRALVSGEWQGLAALNRRALLAPDCEVPTWAYLVSAHYGDPEAARDAYARLAACDPLAVRPQINLAGSYLWLKQPQLAQKTAENALRVDHHHLLIWAEVLALAMQGDFAAAERITSTRKLQDEVRPFVLSMLAAMRGEFRQASDFQNDYLALHGPDDQSSLVMEAARGNRAEANRLASIIDRRPFGHMSLMQAIYACLCGAPFDLEAAPLFAAMFGRSGLAWPPGQPAEFPLKDW